MMDTTASVHVVSKHDNVKHASFPLETINSRLPASSVRVKTQLVAITSNNLSYARGGSVLKWWNTFPVPQNAPSPYNNAEDWGIVPAWGYGEIVESSIEGLNPGTTIWGFWPTSDLPVELTLETTQPTGHWKEVSSHRSEVMNLYNRYVEVEPVDLEVQAWTAVLKPLWEGGFLLNRFVLPGASATGNASPLHPLGFGHKWTSEDADLTSAVVVSLSAGTKTGRGFAWQLKRNRDIGTAGPLAFLQTTSFPTPLKNGDSEEGTLPTKTVSYEALMESDTMDWIAGYKPQRIVVVDFGAISGVVELLKKSIEGSESLSPSPTFTYIGVGTEAKVLSDDELQETVASGQKLGKVQFNTSGVRDRAMEAEGAQAYFRDLDEGFEWFLAEEGDCGLELSWGKGVSGENGIEGAWTDMCDGKLLGKKARVFRM